MQALITVLQVYFISLAIGRNLGYDIVTLCTEELAYGEDHQLYH